MKKTLVSLVCFLCALTVFGQESSVNTSGGNVANSNGSVSYSIGQTFYVGTSNSYGSVRVGVQQVYQISSLRLEENRLQFSLSTFPNPTNKLLILRVDKLEKEQLTYKLIDTRGGLLQDGEIQSDETILNMSLLPVSTYFVEVYHGFNKVKTFQIIKNQ